MPCDICRADLGHPEWCECIHCSCYLTTVRVRAAINRRDLERGPVAPEPKPERGLTEYGRLVLAASQAVEALNKQEKRVGLPGQWVMAWLSGGGG